MVESVTIACNGISTLDVTRYKTLRTVTSCQKHCNIISVMVRLKETIPIMVAGEHLKGPCGQYDYLDMLSQLNVSMDMRAKDLVTQLTRNEEYMKNRVAFSHPYLWG